MSDERKALGEVIEHGILRPLARLCRPDESQFPRVRFRGEEFVFIGAPHAGTGPLVRPGDYAAGKFSYAQLTPAGVMRYGSQIGEVAEVEWLP
jgi:hypothetical protein